MAKISVTIACLGFAAAGAPGAAATYGLNPSNKFRRLGAAGAAVAVAGK